MSNWLSYWRVQTKLEPCTGRYAVGCTDFMCLKDVSAGVDGELGSLIRFFYPTTKTTKDAAENEACHWIPRKEYTSGLVGFMKLPVWLLGGFFYWSVGSVRIPATYNAHVANSDQESGLPCVVFSHGLGGNRFIYSTYCCELASQGCVVACMEHRDKSASGTFVLTEQQGSKQLVEEWIPYHTLQPDEDEFLLRNSQVHQRANECVTALNIMEKIQAGKCPKNLLDGKSLEQFKGRLDLNRVAVVGHSFGGATALATLAKDKRFKCGVALDVWMLPLGEEVFGFKIDQPVLFVNSEAFHRWKENMDPLKRLINQKSDTRPVIAIRLTEHMAQTDIPSVLPPYMLRWTGLGSKLDQSTAVRLNREAMWMFVCRYLGIGNPPPCIPILDGGEGTPERIIIGTEFKPHQENKQDNGKQSSLYQS